MCDLNGERYRSTEYTYALLRTEELFVKTRVGHPADCWGDVGAASGPLFASLALPAVARLREGAAAPVVGELGVRIPHRSGPPARH